jgi:hypothetical protein
MRQQMMLSLLLAVIGCSVTLAPTPLQAFQGTEQEQAACRRDVARFCKQYPPDELLVLNCLRRERAKITDPCRHVLESHGQ